MENSISWGQNNAMEWLDSSTVATISADQKKWYNKLLKLAKEHPEDVKIISQDKATIVAHVPVKYIKLSPPRKISDEQKAAAAERFILMHKNKAKE